MSISALVFATLMPLQITSGRQSYAILSRPLAIAVYVDCSKILGLPKFRLRDSRGNPYIADKALLQEPLAVINDSAGVIFPAEINKRKLYLQSYVRR
jgi:hypothetical protein